MNDNIQHKLKRVRPPRVKISYDVEIGDAVESRELPFVGAIVSDLAGDNSEEFDKRRMVSPLFFQTHFLEIN